MDFCTYLITVGYKLFQCTHLLVDFISSPLHISRRYPTAYQISFFFPFLLFKVLVNF